MILWFYIQAIQELLQSARAGAPINESDIPPEPSVAGPSSTQPKIVSQEVPLQTTSPSLQPSKISLPTNDKPIVSRRM